MIITKGAAKRTTELTVGLVLASPTNGGKKKVSQWSTCVPSAPSFLRMFPCAARCARGRERIQGIRSKCLLCLARQVPKACTLLCFSCPRRKTMLKNCWQDAAAVLQAGCQACRYLMVLQTKSLETNSCAKTAQLHLPDKWAEAFLLAFLRSPVIARLKQTVAHATPTPSRFHRLFTLVRAAEDPEPPTQASAWARRGRPALTSSLQRGRWLFADSTSLPSAFHSPSCC